jgi:hypothetical protein
MRRGKEEETRGGSLSQVRAIGGLDSFPRHSFSSGRIAPRPSRKEAAADRLESIGE